MEFKSFEDFRDQFIEDVKQKLDEQGTDVSIKGNTVTKLNESYEAITMMGIESCGMLISAVHNEEGEEKLHLLMLDNHIPAGAKMY